MSFHFFFAELYSWESNITTFIGESSIIITALKLTIYISLAAKDLSYIKIACMKSIFQVPTALCNINTVLNRIASYSYMT